jgi:copper ion binding protein
MTRTWTVTGMTCHHCAAAVTEEVGAIPGVRAVDVALDTGLLTVDSDTSLTDDAVRGAVEEAGYHLG